MNRKALFGTLTAISLAIGCASSFPTSEDLVRRDAALAEQQSVLHQGRTVAITQCGACHRQFGPAEYAPAEWGSIGRRMGRRAGIGHQSISALITYMEEASRAERRGPTPPPEEPPAEKSSDEG